MDCGWTRRRGRWLTKGFNKIALVISNDDRVSRPYLGRGRRLLAGPTPERLDADPYFNSQRALVIAPAAQLRPPAIYEWREFAEAGGLMSCGTSLIEAYRQASDFVVRILIGCVTGGVGDRPPSSMYILFMRMRAAANVIAGCAWLNAVSIGPVIAVGHERGGRPGTP